MTLVVRPGNVTRVTNSGPEARVLPPGTTVVHGAFPGAVAGPGIPVPGPAGPPGPPGTPGSGGDLAYTHTQLAPSTTWLVTHNLGKYPAVTVVDSGGTLVVGDVQHTSPNQLTITFTAAFGGVAHLN